MWASGCANPRLVFRLGRLSSGTCGARVRAAVSPWGNAWAG
jgi:hypothetical protein